MNPMHCSVINFDKIEVNDIPVLFTYQRVDRNSLPEGYFAYDIRGGEKNDFATIEPFVVVNHSGTILTEQPIEMTCGDYTPVEEYNFTGEKTTIKNRKTIN